MPRLISESPICDYNIMQEQNLPQNISKIMSMQINLVFLIYLGFL